MMNQDTYNLQHQSCPPPLQFRCCEATLARRFFATASLWSSGGRDSVVVSPATWKPTGGQCSQWSWALWNQAVRSASDHWVIWYQVHGALQSWIVSQRLVHGIKVEMPHEAKRHRANATFEALARVRDVSVLLIEPFGRVVADDLELHSLASSLSCLVIHPLQQLGSHALATHSLRDHNALQVASGWIRSAAKAHRHQYIAWRNPLGSIRFNHVC